MNFGLHEIVRQPTLGKYLLDLCLTDLGDETASAKVLPAIADHNGVLARFSFKMDFFFLLLLALFGITALQIGLVFVLNFRILITVSLMLFRLLMPLRCLRIYF